MTIADPTREMFDRDTASKALGIELLEASEGRAVTRMLATEAMINGHGMMHGGYLFLFADTAFACACNSFGPTTVAAGADISFLNAVRQDDVLYAFAELRSEAGRNGIYDVTVRRDDGVVAEFRGHSRTLRERE